MHNYKHFLLTSEIHLSHETLVKKKHTYYLQLAWITFVWFATERLNFAGTFLHSSAVLTQINLTEFLGLMHNFIYVFTVCYWWGGEFSGLKKK